MTIFHIFLLLGGLGMFLYGMRTMSGGLLHAAGDKMKKALEKATANPLKSFVFGAGLTAAIQSSSATTVMVVGLTNAGLMTLHQAAGVIMGANIGSTVTAQIIAFNLSAYTPLLLFLGAVMTLFIKKEKALKIGSILLGFGILFMGLSMMSDAMKPLQTDAAFTRFLTSFRNPLQGVLMGTLFTAVIQSSSASIGILQSMAMSGLIDLDRAVYVVLGQNIGTCITALLASAGTNINSKRAALIHLLFNVLGAILCMAAMALFPATDCIRLLGGNASRQIANFHTASNIFTAAVLLPFAKKMVWIAKRIIPDKGAKIGG